jgi:hypothetical protein
VVGEGVAGKKPAVLGHAVFRSAEASRIQIGHVASVDASRAILSDELVQ